MNINRRKFLAGSLASISASIIPFKVHSNNPEVVVIGAGAAGLAATDTLLKNGISTMCIEANNRIGGRALTDNSIFGVPYDVGAHWIQNSKDNPFREYGEQVKDEGFEVYKPPTKWGEDRYVVYDGTQNVTGTKSEDDLWKLYEEIENNMYNAALAGKDIPASDVVVRKDSEWFETAHQALGAYEGAKDYKDISCVDWANYPPYSISWYCKQGYGALLSHRWKHLPVQFNTTVESVDWNNKNIKISTSNGDIVAKKCIITVSNGILSSDQINFLPNLPAEKMESIHKISMGVYNHVAMTFHPDFFKEIGIRTIDTYLYYKIKGSNPSPRGMAGLMNISGSNLCYFDTGGDFAIELEKEGSEAQIDFTTSELKSLFGSKIDRYLKKSHATQWGNNKYTLGSYAAAEPGYAHLRETIRIPLNEKLYFAGEATAHEYASVSGAHRSGIRAANEVLQSLI